MQALPTFLSKRLKLTETTDRDLLEIARLWDERSVRQYLFDNQEVTAARATEIVQVGRQGMSQGLGLWSVRYRYNAAIIATAGLMRAATSADFEPRLRGLVEPIVAVDPRVQRQGIASEALEELFGYAFDTLGLAQLGAATDVPNLASLALLERLGFRFLSEVPGPVYRLRTFVLSAVGYKASRTMTGDLCRRP